MSVLRNPEFTIEVYVGKLHVYLLLLLNLELDVLVDTVSSSQRLCVTRDTFVVE